MEDRKVTNKDLKFGKRLQRVRKSAGFTQEKLAEGTRLSTTFIGLLEIGQRRPSMKTLQKIASTLKVDVKDLF
ncbi:MAG: helix-turn-helix transcriptional regulator [Candidatus Shapirobacteria bacterium]|nr:helix-turn-helix transcriptional regulator [Candidatus Shapirobacteria bacterium]